MANQERAEKWLRLVKEDLSVGDLLFNNGHWLYTAYMCHQAIENFLDEMVPMNIEARYNEYKDAVAGILNHEKTKQTLEKTKQLYEWILQRYSEKTKLLHSSDDIKK